MTVVNIYDAKTQLSKLIEEAAAGNDRDAGDQATVQVRRVGQRQLAPPGKLLLC